MDLLLTIIAWVMGLSLCVLITGAIVFWIWMSRVKLTKEDMKRGKVIAKFQKQAVIGNAMLEDKMFFMIVNDRPKEMPEAEWFELIRKVLRVEIVQEFPKLFPIGERDV